MLFRRVWFGLVSLAPPLWWFFVFVSFFFLCSLFLFGLLSLAAALLVVFFWVYIMSYSVVESNRLEAATFVCPTLADFWAYQAEGLMNTPLSNKLHRKHLASLTYSVYCKTASYIWRCNNDMVPESHQGDIEVSDYDGGNNYDYYNQCYQ